MLLVCDYNGTLHDVGLSLSHCFLQELLLLLSTWMRWFLCLFRYFVQCFLFHCYQTVKHYTIVVKLPWGLSWRSIQQFISNPSSGTVFCTVTFTTDACCIIDLHLNLGTDHAHSRMRRTVAGLYTIAWSCHIEERRLRDVKSWVYLRWSMLCLLFGCNLQPIACK